MDVSLKALISAFAVALLLVSIRCSRVKEILETITLRNCSNGPPVSNYFHNVSIVQERRDLSYAAGDFKVDEPGPSRMKWKILLYKCTRRDALPEQEWCEFFMKIDRNDICTDIKLKNQIWSHFLDSSDPPISCPVGKGVYKFSKITLDLVELSKFAAGIPFAHNFFWMTRVFIYNVKKAWTCIEYGFKLSTTRA